jgi:hypothetical protein
MARVAKLIVIQAAVFLVGLVLIEFALRAFFPLPVHGGIYLGRDGHPVRPSQDAVLLKPNLDILHKGSEFSAKIRTNSLGYRRIDNEDKQPDFVFIGDSFTFGHGVPDEEVFSYIFCTKNHFVCQNLGRSGTATYDQLKVLDYALQTYGLRPKTVALVMLAACWLESSGNDLGENLARYRARRQVPLTDASPGAALASATAPAPDRPAPRPSIAKQLQAWLGEFEITKRLMLVLSSPIKRGSYSCSEPGEMAQALEATKAALTELDQLAKQFGFGVMLFVIHPYQELDGAFRQTERDLHTVVPSQFAYVPTGQFFRPEHYYRYDGHFNAAGHANMAAVIERSVEGR